MWILISLACSLPGPMAPTPCEHIEINHYCPNGEEQFVQVIAWEWSPQYKRHHVCWWTMNKFEVVSQRPFRIRVNDRVFQSQTYRETWSSTDRERDNQNLLPTKFRRGDVK